MWPAVIIVLIGLITIIWAWSKRTYSQFSRHGLPEAKAWFPLGSIPAWGMVTGTPFTMMYNKLYDQWKHEKMVGFYGPGGSLQLLVNDLDLAKTVLVKDFDYLQDRRDLPSFGNEYLDNMVTVLKGDRWRQMRNILTPVFTGGKLKLMLPLIDQIGEKFAAHLEEFADKGLEFETKEMMSKFSLEVIASTAFGVEAEAFTNPDGVFSDRVARMTGAGKYKRTVLQNIKFFMMVFVLSKFSKYLPKKWTQFFDIETTMFFANVIKAQIDERRKNPGLRHDFIDTLTQAVESERGQDKSAFESKDDLEMCVIANAFVMFFAGFDTTSTGSSLCAFYLAKNQDCQERLYGEIQEAVDANNGNQCLDYAALHKLPYLEACLAESLRAYPLINIERTVTKPYKIPGTEMILPLNSLVVVPGSAIDTDTRYWETPEKFNPDHFSDEAMAKIGPFAESSFGHGPRNCVGKRFALLQLKVAMVRLIYNYKLLPCEKTIDKMVPDIASASLLPKGGMWIKIEKR